MLLVKHAIQLIPVYVEKMLNVMVLMNSGTLQIVNVYLVTNHKVIAKLYKFLIMQVVQ